MNQQNYTRRHTSHFNQCSIREAWQLPHRRHRVVSQLARLRGDTALVASGTARQVVRAAHSFGQRTTAVFTACQLAAGLAI